MPMCDPKAHTVTPQPSPEVLQAPIVRAVAAAEHYKRFGVMPAWAR